MSTMQVDIVTPDRKVYSEQAEHVTARTLEGEIGILPRHSPLVGILQPSIVRIVKDGQEKIAAVSGGFIEVGPEAVTILAETAEYPEDIDIDRAEAAKARAEKRLREQAEDLDRERAERALKRAVNRIETARRKQS